MELIGNLFIGFTVIITLLAVLYLSVTYRTSKKNKTLDKKNTFNIDHEWHQSYKNPKGPNYDEQRVLSENTAWLGLDNNGNKDQK